MQGWSEKFLACAAREVLLKAVIQSIFTYSMCVFLLTKKVCKSLTSAMAKYWWSSSLDRKSLHWISWSKLATPKVRGGIGFRDLHLFNLALLGKHGWRFMTNTNSLCARVLKGRYFPECDFMQASVPRSASATWRAIVAGREALQTGLIKRVGSGDSISIWEDKWIPDSYSMKPLFKPDDNELAKVSNTKLEKVSQLIDGSSWTWRRDLVRSVFALPDAEAILNIPLRNGGGEDFYAWNHEVSGVYSVKSAYRALVNQKERSAPDEGTVTETSTTEQQMWAALWKLNVVPKVRVFWWRVLRGILPDECTLKRRHIKQMSTCSICLAMDEDLMHAMIKCSHARRFWEEARRWLGVDLPRLHPTTWAKDILCDQQFSDQERAKIITVMWSIWHSRNRWKHDQELTDPEYSVKATREALTLLEVPRQQFVLPGHGWRPPDFECVKINIDGAINFADGQGGAGGVARSSCRLLGAWSKPLPGITNPLIAESLALRDGVLFAKIRGLTQVIMETDCLEVVNLWNTRHDSRSIVAPLLVEVGELALSFDSFVIQHVMRTSNYPAHLCAKRASTLRVTESWMDETPSFLISSLLADCPANAFI
jgi:ribonuclease HI